jgi:hypothetical protein
MSGAGAELGVVFAPPGFQHRKQSSTNGLLRQDTQNATKEETMPEKQKLVFTPQATVRMTVSLTGSIS